MSKGSHPDGWRLAAALLLAATALPGIAQEKPLNLTGVFTAGFYRTDNRDGRVARLSSVPVSLDLNLTGFLGHPDFISYQVRPQTTMGAQATEAGFIPGNGVSLTTTFLHKRSFPLTLTYTNLRREQVTYGTLTRISGLRSVSHDRNFGLNWQWHAPHLPQLSFDFGRSRSTLKPDEPIIPDYRYRNRHATLNINDRRWGWTLNGLLRWDRSNSDFANPLEPQFITTALNQRSSQYQFTAQRPLWSRSQVIFSGGLFNNRNTFNNRPFDQDTRFFNAMLTFGWGERLEGNVRTGYTSNLLGTEIQEALLGLTVPGGSGSPTPQSAVFVPFQTRVSSLSASGNVRYKAHRDWTLLGGFNQEKVSAPENRIAAANANFLSGTGGVSFNRRFSWATLTSQYGLNVGRLNYANIPNSRFLGHSFTLTAQSGRLERLELTALVNISTQRVDQFRALHTGTQSAEFTLGRRLGGLVWRGALGMQRSSFRDGGLDYRAQGLTYRASVEHQRIQLHYFRNVVDGDTFQFLLGSQLSTVLVGAPLRVVLSSFRTQTLSVRATPWRRMEFHLGWTTGRQSFDRRVNNEFEQIDVRIGYRFRLLTLESGYARYDQDFLNLTRYMRNRFYLRVSRPFKVF